MKRIAVILGHPDRNSLCGALAMTYGQAARDAGAEVREIRLGELKFDPVLWHGYNQVQELEPDLVATRESIEWAEHLAFVYPNWWGGMPAQMKGFFDRAFLPGFAFKYRNGSPLWDKLLRGRTAELIVTMDTPCWYNRWIYRRPGYNEVKRTILGFCGIKTVRVREYAVVRHSSRDQRQRWIAEVAELGRRAAG